VYIWYVYVDMMGRQQGKEDGVHGGKRMHILWERCVYVCMCVCVVYGMYMYM
jgi:hypothetical protein